MDSKFFEPSAPASEPVEGRCKCARHQLVIAAVPLACNNVTTRQLQHFVTAALALRDACRSHHVSIRPLDVLLWLRRRLNQEAKKSDRDDIYRAQCRRETLRVEREIRDACIDLSRGGLEVLE